MRLRLFLLVWLLLPLACLPSFSEEKYVLTAAEYDQIIMNMMAAQKALSEADSELEKQESELETLRTQFQSLSLSLERQKKEARNDKILVGVCALCLGIGIGGVAGIAAAK